MRIFIFQIFLKQLLPFLVNTIVQTPQVQNKIKHIITGDDTAVPWHLRLGLILAGLHIIFKKIRAVIRRIPAKSQLFRNHIQSGGLAGSISPVQHGNRFKIQHPQGMPGQNLKGVKRIIAFSFNVHQKAVLPLNVGKRKM